MATFNASSELIYQITNVHCLKTVELCITERGLKVRGNFKIVGIFILRQQKLRVI